MNKKNDEIIEQIKTAIRFKKMPIPSDYHISIYDMEQLLDYITNLQEEYKRLKERNEINIDRNVEAYKIVEKLRQRIDKAIETLEKRIEENEEIDYVDMTGKSYINYQKEIIDILRDEDIKEIPQFEGTLEQLDKLSIKGE